VHAPDDPEPQVRYRPSSSLTTDNLTRQPPAAGPLQGLRGGRELLAPCLFSDPDMLVTTPRTLLRRVNVVVRVGFRVGCRVSLDSERLERDRVPELFEPGSGFGACKKAPRSAVLLGGVKRAGEVRLGALLGPVLWGATGSTILLRPSLRALRLVAPSPAAGFGGIRGWAASKPLSRRTMTFAAQARRSPGRGQIAAGRGQIVERRDSLCR